MATFTGARDPARSPNVGLVGVPGGADRLVTPALVVDLPVLLANLQRMAGQCERAGMALRPHGKTHKCVALAREQLAAGAGGICATTAREAIVYAEAGIPGLLVTTPIVQPAHIEALAALHRGGADLTPVLDTVGNVAAWEAALGAVARRLPALVDLDIGMGRTGAATPADAVAIARRLDRSPSLAYAGLQAYSGMVQHIPGYAERRSVYGGQLDRLRDAVAALAAAGLVPAVVSGGGTGTFGIDAERGIFTESQAGSYCFMDTEYDAVELVAGEANPFRSALHLRTSVVSANQPGHATINAGFKSLAADGPVPRVREGRLPGSRYEFFGDEFGLLAVPGGVRRPAAGDVVDLQAPHCDPTVNLHDFYHVLDGDTLVDIWAVDARGPL